MNAHKPQRAWDHPLTPTVLVVLAMAVTFVGWLAVEGLV